jgi:hypothetical protein
MISARGLASQVTPVHTAMRSGQVDGDELPRLPRCAVDDRLGSMLSKKVFLAGEPNFSAPPVHAARADVRDHVESQEGDHRALYECDRGLQKRRQANIVFREVWGAAQFSTFSTASVKMSRATHFIGTRIYLSKRTRQPTVGASESGQNRPSPTGSIPNPAE